MKGFAIVPTLLFIFFSATANSADSAANEYPQECQKLFNTVKVCTDKAKIKATADGADISEIDTELPLQELKRHLDPYKDDPKTMAPLCVETEQSFKEQMKTFEIDC